MSWVIDASVGFAWVHPDQATAETDLLLQAVTEGVEVAVPALWFLEIANTLLVLQRRKRLTLAEKRTAVELLSSFNFTVDDEAPKAAFHKTLELAEKHGLSVYDATYLELALRRKLGLASRDSALLAAARKSGVKVL